MSTFRVEVVKIDEILPHPGADRLSIAKIFGWYTIIQKDKYIPGQVGVYVPIDSCLGEKIENLQFPPDSKIKLDKHRVKTVKIRQAYSQGLFIAIDDELERNFPGIKKFKVGDCVADHLGITKYEPPAAPMNTQGNQVSKKKINPFFKEYTGIENFKYYTGIFNGEMVIITSKLHGTNFRIALMPTVVNTLWRKILRLFNFLPPFEYCIGSHRVQMQQKPYSGYYEQNVYEKAATKYNLREKLEPGVELFGEVVSSSIQKGYSYGYQAPDVGFYAFDILKDGKYLDYCDFEKYCILHNIPMVPKLYEGIFDYEIANNLRSGDEINPPQKIREGIVIRPIKEGSHYAIGRKVLKFVSDEYLLKDTSYELTEYAH